MKVYFGPAGVPLTSMKTDTVSGIGRVAELGLNSMEIEFVRGVKMGKPLAEEVGKAAERMRIKLSVHAPYFINLCNPEKAGDSQKRILDSCDRASRMGAWVVVFHPGYYGDLEKKKALEMVEKCCAEMAGVLKKQKPDVKLGLETTGKVSQFGTVDEILEICGRIDGCVPVLDWAHLYAIHKGKPDYGQILESVVSAGFRKIHTHFSNIEFTDKGERRHLTIDHKKPDFVDVAKTVLGSGLEEITFISESPVLEQDSLTMKKLFERVELAF